MKKLKQLITAVIVALFTAIPIYNFGQSSSANNTPLIGKFLGYDDAQDLDFKTNNILRLQLMETQANTINGFPGIAQGGFVGLSDEFNFFNPGGTGPYSMLHINGDNAGATPQQAGWRPWMRYGMTVTSNRDLMYVGHLDRGNTDETDAVVSWSDNTFGPSGPDNLRFIYTSGDGTAAPGDEDSFYGLEAGRFSGQGRFGCGDFSPSGANEQPTHQLDVNGPARVRSVPAGVNQVLITGRQQSAVGDYVLSHLAFSGDGGEVLAGDGTWIDGSGVLCDWNIVNAGNDLAAGYPGACVEGNVGIGDLPPGGSKLYVEDLLDTPNDIGIEVITPATAANTMGISATIESIAPGATQVTGVHGLAINGKFPLGGLFEAVGEGEFLTSPAVGVFGHATSIGPGNPTFNSIGVYGLAESSVPCDRPIGVYGQAINSTGCGSPIAGYFAGIEVDTQPPVTLSDESIKTDVTEIENATEILQQIFPKSYNFIPDENAPNAYSSEMNYGFLAQEVQEVLPNIVQSVPAPIHFNEEGEIVSSEEELLGIQYGQLIPILVAGFQEQQSQIEARDAEIADLQQGLADQSEMMTQMMDQLEMLQQQINGCCNGDALPKNFGTGDGAAPDTKTFGENELYQNVPNPFRGQTTIRYTLEQGGRAMLNIHDSKGREITQLENAEQVAGTYSYVWDATGLPAGTYHYSLVVDGELLVKRAIKLKD